MRGGLAAAQTGSQAGAWPTGEATHACSQGAGRAWKPASCRSRMPSAHGSRSVCGSHCSGSAGYWEFTAARSAPARPRAALASAPQAWRRPKREAGHRMLNAGTNTKAAKAGRP